MGKPNIPLITENLIKLQQAYAFTYRVMVTQERYKQLIESKVFNDYTYDLEAIREPLIEHVGHLPIIASYLHPHIKHRDKVNLGRILIMLSIHDIGETVLGDVLTYAKVQSQSNKEAQVTKKLLPDYLYSYFEEMEKRETIDAKFAKSVDSIAPLLHEMTLPPQVLIERFKYHNFNLEKIIAKKKVHFEWDSVLQQIFSYLVEKYKDMEKNQSL